VKVVAGHRAFLPALKTLEPMFFACGLGRRKLFALVLVACQ